MNPIWLSAGAAAVVLLLLVIGWALARSRRGRAEIDHGTISDSWLAEQKMASRDRFSS